MICPTVSNCFRGIVDPSDGEATLHGVVFDILDPARLDIVVDDVLPMQVVERLRDLLRDAGRLFIGQRQFGQPRVSVVPAMTSITT